MSNSKKYNLYVQELFQIQIQRESNNREEQKTRAQHTAKAIDFFFHARGLPSRTIGAQRASTSLETKSL